ncbi:MAG TPA: ribosome biogenesis GTPase YlqF [Acholeplasmataceae bacterium]|nr:ribosome biogenesis GTPase YlqF [Acholeplasmataceae bacterium]
MIQWYPGHMAKTKKEIQKNLKLVDIVIELLDARIPISSENPMIAEILQNKARLILLTKSTMSDPIDNTKWIKYFQKENIQVLLVDSISKYNVNNIIKKCKIILKDKLEKEKNKGMRERPIRAMIVGIPNVGKSTLINSLVNKKITAVANRPGVTRINQWVRINKDLELLDTPGVLWPKFENKDIARKLLLTGAIKDTAVNDSELGLYFLDFLKLKYPNLLIKRYGVEVSMSNDEILKHIARSRGFFNADEVFLDRAIDALIVDFRNERIGRISLDKTEDYE